MDPDFDLTTDEGRMEFVKHICFEMFDAEGEVITPNLDLYDLEVDSIAKVEIAMWVEDTIRQQGFDVRLSTEEVDNVYTIQDLLDLIKEKIG